MPRIQSAKKRVAVTERNRQRNMAYKSSLKTALKKALAAVTAKAPVAELAQAQGAAQSVIDRAILKGMLHKNTGARYKTRLAKKINLLAAGA